MEIPELKQILERLENLERRKGAAYLTLWEAAARKRDGESFYRYVSRDRLQRYADILKATGKVGNLTHEEVEMFIEIAASNRLNPFKREIHVAKYKKRGDLLGCGTDQERQRTDGREYRRAEGGRECR